jgi:hypothetical protein
MRPVHALLGLTVASIVLACSAEDDSSESEEAAATSSELGKLFDVNDVSILFPLKNGKPSPAIKVSEGELWTAQNFKEVTDFAKKDAGISDGTKPTLTQRDVWHVMALRFDPCAPGFSTGALAAVGGKCIIQLRLIVQPVVTTDRDFTAHLVFSLGQVDKADLPNSPVIKKATELLGKIKAASGTTAAGASMTAGVPLGVHPGLKKDGSGPVEAAVRELITTFTARSQRAIAFMGLENGGPEPWNFFAGQVDASGAWKQLPIGPLKGAAVQKLDFLTGKDPLNPPGMTSPLFAAGGASNAAIAFKVEHSQDQHFFNTDCVSCHTSSARIHQLRLPPTGKQPAVANITGYVTKEEAQDSRWNVRNFGYFIGKPTVSGRTVAETVDVVEFFNREVINKDGAIKDKGKAIFGVGPDCTDADEKVWTCFRDGQASCLKSCKTAPQPTEEVTDRPRVLVREPEAKDPCLAASASEATPATTRTFTANGGPVRAVKLETNDMRCLTRVLGGFFASPNVLTAPHLQIACEEGAGSCEVSMPDKSGPVDVFVVKDAEAKRFKKFFRSDRVFRSRGTGAGVQISCDKDKDLCTVSVAEDRAALELPAGTTLVNP